MAQIVMSLLQCTSITNHATCSVKEVKRGIGERGTSISIYAAQTCFSRSQGNKDRNGAEQFSQMAVRHYLLAQTFNMLQTLLWLLRIE